jgi:hypothetical protein
MEFLLFDATVIGVFQKISDAEVRVYAFLLEHCNVNAKIVINEIIRKDIVNGTKLKPGSINNTFKGTYLDGAYISSATLSHEKRHLPTESAVCI